MKTTRLFAGLAIAACIGIAGCNAPKVQFETINVEAPFEMEAIQVPVYPAQDFCITAYGATDTAVCTKAIAQAIADCHVAGGGRVVIPAGEWLTGPIHLKSNVNLIWPKGLWCASPTIRPITCLPYTLRGREWSAITTRHWSIPSNVRM